MKTLVKFYLDGDKEVFAVFPQLNYNKTLYGNEAKQGYARIGQHHRIDKSYYTYQTLATQSEYAELKKELEFIGYDLRVCQPINREAVYDLPAYWGPALINNDFSGMEDNDMEEYNAFINQTAPGDCVDCSQDTDFKQFNGLLTETAKFTFIKY